MKHIYCHHNHRYQTSNISGQVNSGTNLMLSYFLQQKWDLFFRVSHRIKVKLKNHNSPMFNDYYQWLNMAYKLRELSVISEQDARELQGIYNRIGQDSVQKYLAKAAESFGLDMGYQPAPKQSHEPELLELLPLCNWQLYQNMPISELITHTRASELF